MTRHLKKTGQEWKSTGMMPEQFQMIIPDGLSSSPDVA